MEEHKRRVLILIGVILVLISLVAILLGIIFKEEKENEPSSNPNSSNTNVISKDIEELKDQNIFFTLQNTINDYYILLGDRNSGDLLKILDEEYIYEKNINSSNIYSILGNNFHSTSYVIKNVYYNPNSSVTYYFINGYFTNSSILDEDDFFEYLPSVNYLLIVDNQNKYVIRPLDSSINIESYSKSFNIKNKKINNNFTLNSSNTSDKNKLTMYINEFLNLMFYDTNRAYNMLDDETKKKYNSYQDFENQIMDIYNKYSTSIFAYSVKESNGETVYQIIDDKQNKITIYEINTMNYKIGY